MSHTPTQRLKKWNQVPTFTSLKEEQQYWIDTELEPALIKESLYNPESTDSTLITLRLDPRMLARLKRLARQRYLNYQSMIKQWLAERLEKELEK
ncbi:MAG: BrnA antitoxin family protein [Verrucomicrobiae bacterium]|nr:BrnA antitoxin family protein [Verrucomicrobiae bacterium]